MLFFIEENAGDNMNDIKGITKDMTMEEFVHYMIDNGYYADDLTPIKCTKCNSTNIKDANRQVGGWNIPDGVLTEYDAICDDCGEVLGHWAYGGWSL